MNAGRVSPSLALAAYAEAWISGAKVIVFGDALSPLPERLLERGARHVHVYDSDAERVDEATAAGRAKQISYGPLDQAGSTLRDGVFDFGIIEDLAASPGDPQQLLATLGRALSRRGMALVAARNPDVAQRLIPCDVKAEHPIGYYDFYDVVSRHFDEVRMLGQTPFVGYAIADFSATGDGDVRIDTAFLPSGAEEPEWFLALASALPVSPDAFSVIQIPLADLELPRAEDPALAEQAEVRVAELETALAKLRAEHTRESTKQHDSQVQALQAELAKREEWLTGLESRAATADQRADEMQSELDRLAADNAKSKQERARLEQLVDAEQRAKKGLDDSARVLKLELDKLQKGSEADSRRASKAEAELRAQSPRVAALTAALAESEKRHAQKAAEARQDDLQPELGELEAKLLDQAREVTRLTEDLHKTERFGRQLIVELSELKAEREATGVAHDLARLAEQNAQLAADLEAARWTISSLEANVGAEPTSALPALAAKRRDDALRGEPLSPPKPD